MARAPTLTGIAVSLAIGVAAPALAQYGAYRDEARRLQTQLDFAHEGARRAMSDSTRRPPYQGLQMGTTPSWTYDHKASPQTLYKSDRAPQLREPGSSTTVVISRKETTPAETAQRVEREAAAGSADSQMWIAHMYYDGWGVAANAATAASWFQKAAQAGNADAQFSLATLYHNGEGVPKDPAAALRWYHKAAEQGDVRAQFAAGNGAFKGDGTPRSIGGAVRWYERAADAGHVDSQLALALIYEVGEHLPGGVPTDDAKASRYYAMAAERGNAVAMSNLAQQYYSGRGVAKDEARAVTLWNKAAEKGDLQGQTMVGKLYFFGALGVTRDYAQAQPWIRKAAERGEDEAQHLLGLMYAQKLGVGQDLPEAMRWFRKSADQGNSHSEFMLSLAYANGEGVTKDAGESLRWLKKAADHDHREALTNLGVLHYLGQGVSQDDAAAVKLWRRAAERGHVMAAGNIGLVIEEGRGGPRDLVEAYAWLVLGRATLDADGKGVLAKVEGSLTQAQRAAANARIAALRATIAGGGGAAAAPAPTAPQRSGGFAVQNHVLAQWTDGLWYPGRIKAMANGNIDIAWDDGDEILTVKASQVRGLDWDAGTRLRCKWQDGKYYPGTIKTRKGDRLEFQWDDGSPAEWTTVAACGTLPEGAAQAAKPPMTNAEKHAALAARMDRGDQADSSAPSSMEARLIENSRKAALALGYKVVTEWRPGRVSYRAGSLTLSTEVITRSNGSVRFTGEVGAPDDASRAEGIRRFRTVLFKLMEVESAEKAGFDLDGNIAD